MMPSPLRPQSPSRIAASPPISALTCLETLTLLARQPISGQTGDPRSEDARDGQAAAARRPVEDHRAPAPGAAPAGPEGWPAAAPAPAGPDRHPVRAKDRPAVGGPASRDELRVRDVVLAQAAGLAGRRHLGEDPRRPARTTRPSRQAGLVEVRHRQLQRPRGFWGADTGPNPTDRGKAGSKHHLMVDRAGVPLACRVS